MPLFCLGDRRNDYRWVMLPGLLSHRLFGSVGCSCRRRGVFNAVVAGVYPETWVLMAMMTASIMIGTMPVLEIRTTLFGTFLGRRHDRFFNLPTGP